MIFSVTCTLCGASGLRTAPTRALLEDFYKLKKTCAPGMHTYRIHALYQGQVTIEPVDSLPPGTPAPTI